MKIFDRFWIGYYLYGLINKLICISPRCFVKFYLYCYNLVKKIRDGS